MSEGMDTTSKGRNEIMSSEATLVAYHGRKRTKQKYVNRMAAHIEADELIQGQGFENGKGCAIGCTLNDYSHKQFEVELGYPIALARLIDTTFEGLPKKDAQTFALAILEAARPGADLTKVPGRLMLWVLADPKQGIARHCKAGSDAMKAVERVADLWCRKLAGDEPSRAEWNNAANAADDAACAAACAAYAAACAAYNAAYADAAYAAAAYARNKFWKAFANEMIRLVSAA